MFVEASRTTNQSIRTTLCQIDPSNAFKGSNQPFKGVERHRCECRSVCLSVYLSVRPAVDRYGAGRRHPQARRTERLKVRILNCFELVSQVFIVFLCVLCSVRMSSSMFLSQNVTGFSYNFRLLPYYFMQFPMLSLSVRTPVDRYGTRGALASSGTTDRKTERQTDREHIRTHKAFKMRTKGITHIFKLHYQVMIMY